MAAGSGTLFRDAVADATSTGTCLQIVGTINAYCALLAQRAGHKALYLSGAGVANASYGQPDLGLTALSDVLEDAQRITSVTSLPLLVDIDTGWGDSFHVGRAIREMARAGVAAVHLEDQDIRKRCGHRPNKSIVPVSEMLDRIRAAVDARSGRDLVIMARTDAYAVEGLGAALERARSYVEAGADMIFPEAMSTLQDYEQFASATGVPVLANVTEFGRTPLFTVDELATIGVSMALYPLSAFRAMSKAALDVYSDLHAQGTQRRSIPLMQTRDELYEVLGYHAYERKIDRQLMEKST